MIALPDVFAPAGAVALRDQARGGAIVGVGAGTMTITAGAPVAAPPAWLLSGGTWNDAAAWDDAALWEDS